MTPLETTIIDGLEEFTEALERGDISEFRTRRLRRNVSYRDICRNTPRPDFRRGRRLSYPDIWPIHNRKEGL